MANYSQEQIDIIIQQIMDAEDPCSVTNQMVATVLLFLMDTAKEQPNLASSITGLSNTLNTLISGNVNDAIESFNEVIAFLAEVTDEQTLTGLLLNLHNEIAGKASKAGDGRLDPRYAPVVMLDSMGQALDSVGSSAPVLHVAQQGDYIYDSGFIKYHEARGDGVQTQIVALYPQKGLIYCNKKTGLMYRYTGGDPRWVQVGGDNIAVVNNLTEGGPNKALSAEQGKVLKAMIEGLDVNSDTRIGVVDTPSDTVLAAPSARMVKEIYLNLRALFDQTNGLAGIAFLGAKPTWQTVDVPEHTITLGMMTNVSASLNGTSINDNISADEGEVTILLTPSSNNYMSSISIKDASNHDVNFTRNDVSGGTEITFILYGNVTISASASSGIQVNVSGDGITSYSTGVTPSTAAELTIALPAHHTWGTVAITYGTDDITSQCNISPANNANKVITLPNTLSDMSKVISIVANAVEDPFAEVTIDTLTNATISRGNDTLESGDHVYENDVISIIPESGKKLDTATINGNTPTNGDAYNGYTYTVQSSDVSSVCSTMTIVAEASTVGQKTITFNTKWCKPYINGNEVSDGSITVNEGSNVNITIEPLEGFVMAKEQAAKTHNTSNIQANTAAKTVYGDVKVDGVSVDSSAFDTTNNKCVISLSNITQDVTVSAVARLTIVRRCRINSAGNLCFVSSPAGDSNTGQEYAVIVSYVPIPLLSDSTIKYGSGFSSSAAQQGSSDSTKGAVVFYSETKARVTYFSMHTNSDYADGVRTLAAGNLSTSKYMKLTVRATLAYAAADSSTKAPKYDTNNSNKAFPYFAYSTDGTTYQDIINAQDCHNALFIDYEDYTA